MTTQWKIFESRDAQKIIERAPLQVRRKYEFWKEQIIDNGPEALLRWPGFKDHALKGDRQGQRSSYLNDQYRVIYSVARFDAAVYVEEIGPHNY